VHNKKLRILFLAGWFPNRFQPYYGIFIKRHALAVSRFCDVIVFYIKSDPNLKDKIYDIEEVHENGIVIVNLYFNSSDLCRGLFSKIKYVFRFLMGCKKGFNFIEKKFGKPDIVHLNVIHPIAILALFIKFVKKTPYILTEHWTGYMKTRDSYKGWKRKLFTSIVIKNARAVTTVSESLADEMRNRGLSNNYFVVPNAIEFRKLTAISKNKQKKVILHISSMYNHQKNVEGIIKALKNISKSRKDFELRLIGGENDIAYLKSLTKDLGMDQFVKFFGQVSDDKLEIHYNESNFFVLNSNYETFSVVTAESLACGIPVIVTRCGGPEEFVTKEQGIVIEPDNQLELEKAIVNMLDNSEKYDPEKLSEYAQSKFNFEVVGMSFLEIYEKIIK